MAFPLKATSPLNNPIIHLFGTSAHSLLDRLPRASLSHVQGITTSNSPRELKYINENGPVYHILLQDDTKPPPSAACLPAVAIIFVYDISQYDQPSFKTSLAHFKSIITTPQYAKTPIVLLLSNADIFAAKLPSSPLIDWFPELAETRDPWLLEPQISDAMCFLANKFTSERPDQIYVHYTPQAAGEEMKGLNFVQAAMKDILSKDT
jgi:hypothetical protein